MRLTFIAAVLAFLADQASKTWILYGLGLATRGPVEVIPGILTFRLGWNTGVNFGLFANSAETTRWIIRTDIAICAIFAVEFAWRWRRNGWAWGYLGRNWYEIIGMIPLSEPALRGFRLFRILRILVLLSRFGRAADRARRDHGQCDGLEPRRRRRLLHHRRLLRSRHNFYGRRPVERRNGGRPVERRDQLGQMRHRRRVVRPEQQGQGHVPRLAAGARGDRVQGNIISQ